MRDLRNTQTPLDGKRGGKWPLDKPRVEGSIMLKYILGLLLVLPLATEVKLIYSIIIIIIIIINIECV
jgi:hypothetical protein